jgi:hypothetical protein
MRTLAGLTIVGLMACGGGGEDDPIDPDARCSLINESYDAFGDANGARCGDGEGAGYCFEGDLCAAAASGTCELVSTPTGDGYCALLRTAYTAFGDADGKRCGSGEGSGYCIAGDHCREAGVCEAVLSAAKGKPHAELFGKRYDAFGDANGARCGSGEGSGYCLAGDLCVEPKVCALVLNGLGGQLRAELVGSQYTASSGGNGVRCGEGEGSGYCKAGDRCAMPGTCEVVLSAWTP